MSHTTRPQPPIDLSECEREPIHIPGSVQPHGVLLALSPADMTVSQVSQNSEKFLGLPPEAILGRSLFDLFRAEGRASLEAAVKDIATPSPIIKLTPQKEAPVGFLNGVLHQNQGHLILELENQPALDADTLAALQHALGASIVALEKSAGPEALAELAARQVRHLTGYDRVMIYRFDEDWNGQVIAEAKTDDLEPYLGLHYPASDIPPQARELYRRNRLRIIADVDYPPVPLQPRISPLTGQPLDLSLAVLRSVSPIHIEYLQNMGVKATMTISLIHNQELWGMVACHHYAPKLVSYEIRNIAELLSQVLSLLFFQKEESFNDRYRLQLQGEQSRLLNAVTSAANGIAALLDNPDSLLKVVGAQGAALCFRDHTYPVGQTPDPETIRHIQRWLPDRMKEDIFQTNALPQMLPAVTAAKERASGLLALSLSDQPGDYLLWFRPEVIQTVTWGGNPTKPVTITDDGQRLSPRKSFEAWKEIVRLTAKPWHPAELDAAAALGRLKDILIRQQVETVVHRQARVFANVHEGIVVTTPEGTILDWNRGAEQIFGHTVAEAVGASLKTLLLTKSVEVSDILAAAQQEDEWTGEITVTHKRGEQRTVEVVMTPFEHPQDGVTLIGVYRDVTDRKQLERRLQQAQRMEAVGELAGGIAHNFNNMLTALTGYAEFALLSLPAKHQASEDLRRIRQVTERATSLTRQLLDFTRHRATEQRLVNLNELITDIDMMLRQLIHSNIEFKIILAPTLGYIRADPGQIEQVLINLVVNARDAMPDGGELIIETATVTRSQLPAQQGLPLPPGEYVTLSVRDTGIGMSEAIQQRIFDPFFTTKEVGQSTGLGLATCFGIVRQHHGEIMVDSRTNQGTAFTIYLPRVVEQGESSSSHTVEESQVQPRHGGETILLAEDEEFIRELAGRALRQQGYTVLIADNGSVALELLASTPDTPPHLLITDLVMPKLGGHKLAQQLQTQYPTLKVLFISGYAENADHFQGSSRPGTAFLEKPFSPSLLLETVRELLDEEIDS